jgi:glycosyltransferase involved in cell wall biosynthesis
MRLALVSTALGRVLRGFEAFTESLFGALSRHAPAVDATLFQGGGRPGERRIVVKNFHRGDIPARWLPPLSAARLQNRSFALALYPKLICGRYDIVHYNELTMGSALYHLRRRFGGRYKLLYCNGAPSPPIHYHQRCDVAQVLTGPHFDEAVAFGLPPSRLFLMPYGVDSGLFHPGRKERRASVRRELAVPSEARMVLSVAAIKREHKRIGYLIEETARLGADVWLVVAGQRTDDTPDLERMAEQAMPGRWRFVSWPSARVADLYGAADVFALCSLTEAFGLATVEAVMSEVPVLIHDNAVSHWLAEGTATRIIDMSQRGALTRALADQLRLPRDAGAAELARSRETAKGRFGWEHITGHYIEMYRATVQRSSNAS